MLTAKHCSANPFPPIKTQLHKGLKLVEKHVKWTGEDLNPLRCGGITCISPFLLAVALVEPPVILIFAI